MKELNQKIESLKQSPITTIVKNRIEEFKGIDKTSSEVLFKELCFCILTANFSAERSIRIHQKLAHCFCTSSKEIIAQKLKQCGYRFPTTRASYITTVASKKEKLPMIIRSQAGEELREWLVTNIQGLGYKEASHFLRNIGFDDYAIIDSHILDLLERYHIIKQPKTLTKKKYLEIETILRDVGQQTNLTLAELDLYLWYLETGTVLK